MGLTPIIKEHVKNALDVTPKDLIKRTDENPQWDKAKNKFY
tara:strand:+ start:177 stop:299 length:123 start_codon:yes stop_codon:yes gene_type:complete